MFYFLITLSIFSVFAQEETLDTIQVTHEGTSNTLVDFVPSVSTIKGDELKKRRESTLGDTLRNEPGVQSSSFGPNASRPIIRGLDGDRIRILQNGLGILDASSASVDHAVPVDTLVIDSIEVVRGPMSMLYGSSAVGGVVNVNTTRIHSAFEKGAISELLLQGDSSQDAVSTGAKIDYGSNNWMFHIDGAYRNANDLRVPSVDKKDRLKEPGQLMNTQKIPNSESFQKSIALGASHIFSKGFVGMSYYFFDNQYGTVAEEAVDIKMKQNRVELHGEYKLGGKFLKSVRLKTAQSDYGHKEIESGSVGTTFSNDGNESRLEFMTGSKNLKGISGIQTQIFNFSAKGEEAYLPPSRNNLYSVFTLQDLTIKDDIYSLGARFEFANLDDKSSDGKNRSFNGYNGSLGFRHHYSKELLHNISLSYTERLPNFQELFAEGAHLATGTFENGNPELKKEKAMALDVGIKFENSRDMLVLNFYTQHFNDYIALFDTGVADTDSGFNIYDYAQVDAYFYGFDLDARKQLGESPLHLIVKADLVRAKDKDHGTNLPRISAPRTSVGFAYVKDRQTYDIEAQYNFEQTKTAPNESRSDDFTLVNMGVQHDIIKENGRLSLFGRLKNLLNQEARQHTSTLKEIAPMAGRHVVAGLQYSY